MAYKKSNPNGQATMANSEPVVIASDQTAIPVDITQGVDVQFGAGTIDSFGHLITGTINNQVDIQFYRDTVANLTTVTTANGGTATATGGMATFSATTTASSQAKGVSPTTTTYTAGGEIYAIFTAGWTGTGAGTSYQRIGIYNTNDGFYISKEANTFGVTVRKGGVDTFVSTFSEDQLTGAVDSFFTRAGTPEAVNLTKLNVWRIRFGWVGSAPINFEVLSPDGQWVTFHKIKQPNNASLPHIETADLPVTCDVFSGNSGNALTIITNCWAAGTTQALGKIDATITADNFAALTRSVITGETTAGGGGFVNVKVDPSGAVNVSGTVTANLGAVDNAVLDQIELNQDAQTTLLTTIEANQLPDGHNVTVANASIAVTGTFWQATQPVSGPLTDTQLRATPVPVSGTVTASAQPGVDIGDVTINNASIPVTDNAGSLTVDAPVATPVFVRLSDGAAAISTLPVSLASVPSHQVTNAGTFAVQSTNQANSGVDIGDVTINNASGAAAVNIQDGGNTITVDNGGTFAVQAAQSGTWTVQPGNTANTTAWLVSNQPVTSGGLSKYHLVGAATTNQQNVKASAGQVYGITAFNIAATPAYLKFHNTAGSPTAGSGVTDTFLIPGNTAGAGVVMNFDKGIAFSTGIAITIVGGIADANTTAIAADNVVINIYYK
jgi:hypothetical protein